MLVIFNPIYDQAFKYLMENNELARNILNLILDKEIVQLQMQNVETPIITKEGMLTSRYDFKATIKNENGEMQKVLIELQKYKNTIVNRRFRFYLGQNYSNPDTFINSEAETVTEELPILTVYLLGYDYPEIPTRFLKVENKYIDGIKKVEIPTLNCKFVDLLTHKMYILQIGEKKDCLWQGTRIEAFMRLFIQKTKGANKNTIIEIDDSEIEDPLMKKITKYLNEATLDEKLRRQMKAEQEYDETFKENEEKGKEIEDLIIQKEEERRQKEEERRQKEEERRQKEEAKKQVIDLVRLLKSMNVSIDVIIEKTGLSKDEIEI